MHACAQKPWLDFLYFLMGLGTQCCVTLAENASCCCLQEALCHVLTMIIQLWTGVSVGVAAAVVTAAGISCPVLPGFS